MLSEEKYSCSLSGAPVSGRLPRPGNAVFVPPPGKEVLECMSNLELFLHDKPEPTPVLLKAALSHVQFETIHPFVTIEADSITWRTLQMANCPDPLLECLMLLAGLSLLALSRT
jgi:hypothetical protein